MVSLTVLLPVIVPIHCIYKCKQMHEGLHQCFYISHNLHTFFASLYMVQKLMNKIIVSVTY